MDLPRIGWPARARIDLQRSQICGCAAAAKGGKEGWKWMDERMKGWMGPPPPPLVDLHVAFLPDWTKVPKAWLAIHERPVFD